MKKDEENGGGWGDGVTGSEMIRRSPGDAGAFCSALACFFIIGQNIVLIYKKDVADY